MNQQNNIPETPTAFALAVLLLIALILSVVGAAIWIVYSVIVEQNALNAIVRGDFLP